MLISPSFISNYVSFTIYFYGLLYQSEFANCAYFKSFSDCFLQMKFILSKFMSQVLIFVGYVCSTLFFHVFCSFGSQINFVWEMSLFCIAIVSIIYFISSFFLIILLKYS